MANAEAATSTDEASLWEHRTEPLQVVLDPDDSWIDDLYAPSYDHLNDLELAAAEPYAGAAHCWTYTRSPGGEFSPEDPAAPAVGPRCAGPRARGPAGARRLPLERRNTARRPHPVRRVSKTDADRAALADLERPAATAVAPVDALHAALEAQEAADRAAHLEALRAAVVDEAARRSPASG